MYEFHKSLHFVWRASIIHTSQDNVHVNTNEKLCEPFLNMAVTSCMPQC